MSILKRYYDRGMKGTGQNFDERICAAANDSNLSITQIKVGIYRMKPKN